MSSTFRSSLTMTAVLSVLLALLLVVLSAVPSEAGKMGLRPGQRRPNRAMSAVDEKFDAKRQVMDLVCIVEYFPPPNQHLFCCRKTPDCECPRRMGICAPDDVEEEKTDYEDDWEVDYNWNWNY
jgi:hypothetical protein